MSFEELRKLINTNNDPGHPKVKILIVDDDHAILEDFELLFAEQYQVISCQSGAEAVKKISSDIYAVILDIVMPGEDGFWTYEKLKIKYPYIPILFHTAFQNIKDPYEVINTFRPYAYISKNTELNKLTHAIDSAVGYYQTIIEKDKQIEDLKSQLTNLK